MLTGDADFNLRLFVCTILFKLLTIFNHEPNHIFNCKIELILNSREFITKIFA